MIANLTRRDRRELTNFASHVSTLPPDELWVSIADLIDPTEAVDIEQFWNWLGLHLESFFTDNSEELPEAGLTKECETFVRVFGNYYIVLSTLIFQAERFIRAEAKQQNIEYPFKKRSSLLKHLAMEHCLTYILRYLEDYWESPSGALQRDSIKDFLAIRNGRLQDHQIAARAKNLKALQAKAYEGKHFQPITQWTSFCFQVFDKYRDEIPGYSAYLSAIDEIGKLPTFKYAIVDQKINKYPGRGKSKRENKIS